VKVTFSILCHNYGRFLAQAIKSTLVQAHPGFDTETIVIDDGSSDETPEVCREFENAITTIRGPNRGFGHSLTQAVTAASGDYVFLLDADDYLANDKLKVFAPSLQTGAGIVWDRQFVFHASEKDTEPIVQHGGNTSTLAIKRKWALSLLPVENEMAFHVMARAGHGKELATAHTYYRLHENSMTNRHCPEKWYEYLAGVSFRLADRVAELSTAQSPSAVWLKPETANKIAQDIRANGDFCELEVNLLRHRRMQACKSAYRMLMHAMGGKQGVSVFHLKQLARALCGRANFRSS